MDPTETIKIKQCFPYPVSDVWHALTDSKLLGKWFMENDFLPVKDREFTFRMAPQKGWDGITHCKVVALEPMQKISYTYRGSAIGEKMLACAGIHSDAADSIGKGIFTELDTVLTFRLETTCGGACLTMEHSGYRGLKLVIVGFVMGIGWKKQLRKKLPLVLEELSRQA